MLVSFPEAGRIAALEANKIFPIGNLCREKMIMSRYAAL
jgi:hypothetical protein